MTKITRTFLFFILSFLFVLTATSALFYAQGYRFDFKNFKYLKTGAIFVKVSPANAKVFLDQKLIGRTQLINNYLFSQSLLPKEYSVKIEKEGYLPWSKTLEVKEKEVAEAKNIILFPEKISFKQEKLDIKNFYPLNGEKILLQSFANKTEKLSVYDLAKDSEAELEKINIFLEQHNLLELKTIDSRFLLFYAENKKTKKENYFFADLKAGNPIPEKLDFLTEKSKNIILTSSFGEIFFFWEEDSAILKKSLNSSIKAAPFLDDKIKAFSLAGGYFYFLTQEGKIIKTDQNKNFPGQNLTEKSLDINQKFFYELTVYQEKIFLKENEYLYIFNEKGKVFEKIFDGIKDFKLSVFGDKILCQKQNEIEIYLLKDITVPFPSSAGSKIFISRFSQPVQSSDWIENDYFAFASNNEISLSEIDTRSTLNVFNIGRFNEPKIWFCQKNKKLYILSNNLLFSSDKLL